MRGEITVKPYRVSGLEGFAVFNRRGKFLKFFVHSNEANAYAQSLVDNERRRSSNRD